MSEDGTSYSFTGTSKTVYIAAPQLEVGNALNTYVPTTTTAVYNTPQLTFSGVANIGLQSDGALFIQPAGTGALQAQKTDSATTGGNARGAYAADFQTQRASAGRIASGTNAVIGGGYDNAVSGAYASATGGYSNTVSGPYSIVSGGVANTASNQVAGVVGGQGNTATQQYAMTVGGYYNSSTGWFNFIGNGQSNSGTANAAVTTQSGTMNATTAVTLSGSNANIKVGQLIQGTSIASYTYVAAISGTSLTLSQNASGSSTSTLSFFTPHGVVVGGGNNQATGAYSFIGGGGDAGTAANRNVASGDWSFVGGGIKNTASGLGSAVVGGGLDSASNISGNTASGASAVVCGGRGHTASGNESTVLGGAASTANGLASMVQGRTSTTRSITGNVVFAGSYSPISGTGSSQAGLLILARQTTDATATVLTNDGGAAGTTNQIILPNNAAYYFTGTCIANVTGAAAGAAWSFEGAIMRGANAGSTVLIGTPVLNRVAVSSGASLWVVALTADTSNGGLTVTVTGVASTTIRWVAKIETTEVTY
jgi:hypothetical protein